MKETTTYENFPLWIPIASNALSLSICALGAYIVAGFGVWALALYLAYCLAIELRVLRHSCVHCHYYGKVCGLGKGKLCALLLKRGNPPRFAQAQASWVSLLPDFLVSLIPLVAGIVLSLVAFNWTRVGLLAALVVLSTVGNGAVRGGLVCKYCKQREIGCPAQRLFSGEQAPAE